MQFLAENNIVHRDLATRNILIDSLITNHERLKIADYGLSHILGDNKKYYIIKTVDRCIPVKW